MHKPRPILPSNHPMNVCMSCGKQGGTTPALTQPARMEGLRDCPDYVGCLDRQKTRRDAARD